MEFFQKDKLSRLDEERQRRRQQRAEEAVRRLDEIGKQTLQVLRENTEGRKKPGEEEASDASGRRPGALSRVLLEAAQPDEDPRRATRMGKRNPNRAQARLNGPAALRQIHQAMDTIQNAVTDTATAGLKGGLENAARQVTDVVSRVSQLAQSALGMPAVAQQSTQANPLADLMKQEDEERHEEAHVEHHRAAPTLDHRTAPTENELIARASMHGRGFELNLELDARPGAHGEAPHGDAELTSQVREQRAQANEQRADGERTREQRKQFGIAGFGHFAAGSSPALRLDLAGEIELKDPKVEAKKAEQDPKVEAKNAEKDPKAEKDPSGKKPDEAAKTAEAKKAENEQKLAARDAAAKADAGAKKDAKAEDKKDAKAEDKKDAKAEDKKAAKAEDKKAAKAEDKKAEAKKADAKDDKKAEAKKADAKDAHAKRKHGDDDAKHGKHDDKHAKQGKAHDAHAHAASKSVEHAAKSTTAQIAKATHGEQPAKPAATHGAPQSRTPASAKKDALQPKVTPKGGNKAPVAIAAGGQTSVNLQKVHAPAEREIPSNAKQVSQPSFQIHSQAQSAAIPAMPTDLASQPAPKPASAAPPPAAAPAKQAATPTKKTAVQPAPPAAAPQARTANPAIAQGKAAAAAVKVPTAGIAGAAGAVGAAAGAAVAAAGAVNAKAAGPAHPGASSVKTQAPTTKAPPTTPVPKTAMTPSASAPQTPAPSTPAPQIPAVSKPGGEGAPSPSGMVPSTVSLSADRSAASSSIQAEAHTSQRVGPEAQAQRQSQIAPLGPEMKATEKSSAAPKAAAVSSATSQGNNAATQGRAQETAAATSGKQQIAGQMQGAQAERQRAASAPPPAILAQTAPAKMQSAGTAAGAAVASAAHAAAAHVAQVSPGATQRAAQIGATPSQLPAFDQGKFAAIDQHAPLPPMQTTAFEGAQQASAATYQQSNQQIAQLANIQPPQVNLPAGDASGRTKTGQPTREAAIAGIESQIAQRANAEAPAQMRAAAAPVQAQMQSQVATTQQGAQAQAQAQMAQHQAKAQEIQQGKPPITGAQAAAQAQPEYQAHQAEATAASTQIKASVTGAQTAAQGQITAARGVRDQSAATAQQGYQSAVSGQLMPAYAQQQTAANQHFQSADQAAQQAQANDQQQAQQQAQQATDQAKSKADAETQQHQAQLTQQQAAASASHDQQVNAANQQHDAQMQQAQQQSDQQVQQHQQDMQSQVSQQQAQGQQEVNQHLNEGEQGYHQEIARGEGEAQAEQARANQEAEAKKQQAEAEKSKHKGGILGSVVGWVKDRVNDLLDAAKAVLEAAKNLIVSIMEKARQAAMAILEKARQAALAALAKVKSAIQGIISACAAAIRSVISACASMIRGLIQTLANVLKGLVQALTTMLTTLVQAFQAAVNMVLDGLIAAVSLVNKDLGNKLRNATQKYRDAFNRGMDKLQSDIQAAGDKLQQGIQHAADQAIAVVDAAEKTLNDAVTSVENTLNAAVEAAYQVGAAAINKAFDAAEAVVNKAFDAAEAAVKAYFDAQIGALSLVQKGVEAVADFVTEIADKALEMVDKLAQAVINAIPDSWTKALVDFWNGPWRTTIIIGLATIAAVAITAATLGTGAPIAAILLAGVIGGSIAGTAYFGGEMLAREGEIKLSSQGDGMYVPGYGKVQIGPDGQPVPPAGLSPEKLQEFQSKAQWSLSNFNLQHNENGEVTGFDRKSGSEIANYAVQEGIKGFGEGFISGAMAVAGGGVGGALTKSIGNQFVKSVVQEGIVNVVTGPVQSALTSGWDTGFTALAEGKSPMEALKAAGKDAFKQVTDPGQWTSALLMSGIGPAKLKVVTPRLEGALANVKNTAVKTAATKGTDLVVDTMGQTFGTAGGNFVTGYYEAVKEGKSPSEALEAAKKRADEAFEPGAILSTAFMNGVGAAVPQGGGHDPHATPHEAGATPHETGTHPLETASHNANEPHADNGVTPGGHSSENQHAGASKPEAQATQPVHAESAQPHANENTQPLPRAETEAKSKPRQVESGQDPHPTNERHPSIEQNPTTEASPKQEAVSHANEALPDAAPRAADKKVQEQIDRVTGVDRGVEHEQAMADLRDYYTQQQAEGQNTIQVSGTMQEGPYGWNFGHDATEFSNGTTHVEYRVFLDGSSNNISPEHMQQLRENVTRGVDAHYNYQHDITNSQGDPSRLHMEVVFVTDPAQAHTSVTVHSGDGPANLSNWYVDGHSTTHAHEIGHGAFGYLDEYHDASAPNRATPTSPGVSHDGSLMGNYWTQAPDGSIVPAAGTGLRDRHLDQISGLHDPSSQHNNLPQGNQPPAPEHARQNNEPNAPTPDLEAQLAHITENNTGTPQSVEAVRNARAKIETLKGMREQVATGAGPWEHATPAQREARLRLLDDQIHATAHDAVQQHTRNQPRTQSEAVRAIEDRTPQQSRHRAEEVATARAETTRRDAALVESVHRSTITDEHGHQHVEQVFDHITVGNGFAGVANEMSRPRTGGNDIVIGGANPWDGAKSKFGQPAGDSELPHHQDGHGMRETASSANESFMLAHEHADNVALNRNDAGIRAYDGRSGSVEPGPQADWPAFARESGATARTKVMGPDGQPRYFYTKQVDIASGPGPNRRLPGEVMDDHTFQRMMADNAISFGDQSFHQDSVRTGEIANVGPGASGAWVGEAAGGKRDANGNPVNSVEWIANNPRVNDQITPAQKERLTQLQDKLNSAKASGDADQIHAAQVELTNWTFEQAARNGNLPRNQQEGGAFHPDMQAENGGPISRRVTEGVSKVTYEPQVDGGPPRVRIELKDLGPDGQPVVLWKDALVLSIGQDARGAGGPVELVRHYDGKLLPIFGEPDASGFRPVVGVQAPDGSVRVLGAASTMPDVSRMLDQSVMTADQHQANLREQAGKFDENSRGVVQGFVMAEKTIREANNAELARVLEQTPAEQRAEASGSQPPPAPRPDERANPNQHPDAHANPSEHSSERTNNERATNERNASDHAPAEPAPRAERLANHDAMVEQLAHGMVSTDLTAEHIAFLAANGYEAGPIIRGKRDFVMRVFTPTEPGGKPIVSFRGTVPSKIQTIIADLDPRGIGRYQFDANADLIKAQIEAAAQHGPIIFAGHSLGGALAQTAAATYPGHADSILTYQAPGVARDMAQKVEDYNAAHPDNPIDSTHHRVEGDLVPYGGEALTPGMIHNHEFYGGSAISRNPLSKHVSSPLAQEQIAGGHDVPVHGNANVRPTTDVTTAHDNTHKTQTIEHIRSGLGTVAYGVGRGIRGTARAIGSGVRATGRGLAATGRGIGRGVKATVSGLKRMVARNHDSTRALPDAEQQNQGSDNLLPPPAPMHPAQDGAAHDGQLSPEDITLRSAVPPRQAPLASHDAMVEQLAHGMVSRDLTDEHIAFLEANGYEAGPIIRGKRDFVMRVFTPTEPGGKPIVAFRGTVPSKIQTIIADLDPRGIGRYQFDANRDLIDAQIAAASAHGPIIFAGHSLGGALAQTAAATYPGHADSILTYQAPGVARETARVIEDYNAEHPDSAIESTHHRVEGDLVPYGGEALTPGMIHNHEFYGGNPLGRNALSKHVSSPLAQEQMAAGHDVPVHGKANVRPTTDVTTEHENAHKSQAIEHVRAGLGTVSYGIGRGIRGTGRAIGAGVRATGRGLAATGRGIGRGFKATASGLKRMFTRNQSNDLARGPDDGPDGMLPPSAPRSPRPSSPEGGNARAVDRPALPFGSAASPGEARLVDEGAEHASANDLTLRSAVPPLPEPLANHDAMVEQLAHGMVSKDLGPDDLAFLEANGYEAGPIIRGKRDFVMRTFIPTEPGKAPIVSFRGTVPSKIQTIIADLDPKGIGRYQFDANRALIDQQVALAAQHGPIIFSGHSLGGALAQTAAATYPGQAESVLTYQAPGVARDTARAVEDYNAAHPDRAIESTHHRVAGDLVPFGGQALTPGTIHNHEFRGGSMLSRNALSKHVSSPLAQEELAAGHDVPNHGNANVVPTTDVTTAHDNTHKTQVIEHIRSGLGHVTYGVGGAIGGTVRGVKGAVSSIARLFGRRGGDGPEASPDNVGGVRGADVYEPNTRDKDGAKIPVNLNDEKIKKALAPAAKQVDGVTITDQKVAGGGATFKMQIAMGGGTTEVHVVLATRPNLTPSTVHGGDEGPARLTLDHDATTNQWTLHVEINSTVKPDDVHFVIAHELNEAAELIRRNPAGTPASGFAGDMAAGVLKPGATTHVPTAHDKAAAREVVELDRELQRVKKAKPAAVVDRKAMLDRALAAQGLDQPAQIHAKLALLTEAGASPELIKRVQMLEVDRVMDAHEVAIGGKSNFSRELAHHLLFADETGGFKGNGLSGGHLASELQRFAEASGKYVVHEVKTKTAGANTLREFEQYRWEEKHGPRPTAASGERPGGAFFDLGKWVKASKPKTTFDDAAAFLHQAEVAWKSWLAAGATPNADRSITMTSPDGILFGGFVKDLTPPYELATIFIEASWM